MVKFHNISDRENQGKWAVLKSGHQIALSPSPTSNQSFKEKQTIFAGYIAHDRAENERAINVCKRTGLAKWSFMPWEYLQQDSVIPGDVGASSQALCTSPS